jgi:hypothetical protein
MRVESDWPAQTGMGGHLHRLVAEPTAPPLPRPAHSGPIITAAQHGEIGEWILDQLDLLPEHLEHLKGPQRRFSDEQIERRGYRSWPELADRHGLAERAWAEFGTRMRGVPGFYVDVHRDAYFVGPQGLLLPVRDVEGNITAFQVRPDTPSRGKRLWLSSLGRRYGSGSGAPPHVSRPGSGRDVAMLYVVEGVLNADICSDQVGAVCLGLSGVTNWRNINWSVLINQFQATTVIIALDQDCDEGRAQTERTLLRDVCSEHVVTKMATWDGRLAKGLDDCLNADLRFTTS